MEIVLRYLNSPHVNIKTISVIGSFNKYNPRFSKMILEGDYWVYRLKSEPGEHPYRFLINDSIEMIDPESGLHYVDHNDKIWSLLYVNNKGEQMFNTMPSTVNIEKYYMYNKITSEKLSGSKKNFNLTLDKEVCVKFEFTDIEGLHNGTVLWFNPFGELLKLEEHPIYVYGTDATEIHLWSTLPLDKKSKYPAKTWRMNLFINGDFILEDEFEVQHAISYSQLGRLK